MSIFPTKVLLAIDGSEEASLAARTAADLAESTGSELHVIYTMPTAQISHLESMDYDPAPLRERAEQRARALLDEQVEHIGEAGGIVTEAHLRRGRPDDEIVTAAEKIDAGLIVMGSRGLGGVRRSLMGSVSNSVVRHAHCPVMIVRSTEV